jgi:hypothetical protein
MLARVAAPNATHWRHFIVIYTIGNSPPFSQIREPDERALPLPPSLRPTRVSERSSPCNTSKAVTDGVSEQIATTQIHFFRGAVGCGNSGNEEKSPVPFQGQLEVLEDSFLPRRKCPNMGRI